ncbi:amidophosphoribosyltransferase [Candidatus Peribacteria bacterium RIFCSPHIGHO2_01_FULL_51_9]|nr:MAG: amidophosphoribosyltransferase [Candidatus Peribacteria bacterium RIFCSPHIGHO2_01_FULL_51_9]
MCGIIAVTGFHDVIQDLYEGLILLQHRGQDAAGIMTYDDQFYLKKGNGLVREVFHMKSLMRLKGSMGIGHVRYPTAGCASEFEAQPFFVNTPFGIALGHNGNLTNTKELRKELLEKYYRHLNTTSDSEVLLNVFSVALQNLRPKKLTPEHIFGAVKTVFKKCKGAYSVVALIGGHGLVAFRDPYGIRPLQLGQRKNGKGHEYMIASETTAMEALDFTFVRDIRPGEAIFIDKNGVLHSRQCRTGHLRPCLFEWVYLAAPDSTLDNVNVYKARLRMGEALAKEIRKANLKIDSVIPIPDTGRPMAAGLADKLGIRYREGFVKNRYIARTFIMPGQPIRKRSLQFKLHPIELEFKGNNVLLVDDSIVRGNTSKKIIEIARKAGAKKVFFASGAPPIIGPDVYGIDMPMGDDLIAAKKSIKEIEKYIGADKLFYGKLEDVRSAVRYGNPRIKRFSDGYFSGEYATPEVTPALLRELGKERATLRSDMDTWEDEGRGMTLI